MGQDYYRIHAYSSVLQVLCFVVIIENATNLDNMGEKWTNKQSSSFLSSSVRSCCGSGYESRMNILNDLTAFVAAVCWLFVDQAIWRERQNKGGKDRCVRTIQKHGRLTFFHKNSYLWLSPPCSLERWRQRVKKKNHSKKWERTRSTMSSHRAARWWRIKADATIVHSRTACCLLILRALLGSSQFSLTYWSLWHKQETSDKYW